MGRYDRYILMQALMLFGFFSLVLVSVYWINRGVDLFDNLIADGQTLGAFLELTALTLPQIIMVVLPISAFVAMLYVFNRMIAESELVVLQTAGLSPWRLIRPVAYFAVILALAVSVLAHGVTPQARETFAARSQALANEMGARLFRVGVFQHPTAGITLYLRDLSEEDGTLYGIFLQDRRAGNIETTYRADRGRLVQSEDGARLVLLDGVAQTLNLDTTRLSVVQFAEFALDLEEGESEAQEVVSDDRTMTTWHLLTADEALAQSMGVTLGQMRWEGHYRFGRALFALTLPLIAAAALMVGNFSRLGVWTQIALAVAIVAPLQMLADVLGQFVATNAAAWPLAYVQPALGFGAFWILMAYGQNGAQLRFWLARATRSGSQSGAGAA